MRGQRKYITVLRCSIKREIGLRKNIKEMDDYEFCKDRTSGKSDC